MSELKKHTYVVGKSGSGKSYFLKKIFHRLQSKEKYSLVLIEPHGDLAMECRDFALNVSDPDRVEYIEPNWKDGYVPVINPFDLKDKSKESISIFTQELTSVFVELLKKNESTAGASLSTQMDALLKPCIATVLKMEDGSLEDLQDIMSLSPSPRGEAIIKKGLQSEFKPHAKMFYNAFVDPEMKKGFQATRKSIFGKLQSLMNEELFYDMTHGKSTIDLEECLNTGKVVIVNLSKGKIGKDVSQAFGRFVVALIKGIGLKRERIEKKKRKSVFLFVDEFQNYTSESFKDILAELRKYGVHLVISHQNVGQISTDMQTQLLGNTGVKIAGENGNKTLKVMANEMGVSLDDLQQMPKYYFHIKVGSKSAYSLKPPSDLVSKKSPHYMTAEEKEVFKAYKLASGLYRNKNDAGGEVIKKQDPTKKDEGGKRKPKYL